VFFCLHGAKHNWSKLRWVCDVAELTWARPGLDWAWVLDWSGRHGATRLLQVGLHLTRGLLDAPVPDEVLTPGVGDRGVRRLVREMRSGLLACPPRPEPDLELPWRSSFYRSMDRWRDRARWVYEVILLPGELEWGLLPLPAALAPAYYPVRLLRLGGKYLGRLLRGGLANTEGVNARPRRADS
jgi:hypothetical protein